MRTAIHRWWIPAVAAAACGLAIAQNAGGQGAGPGPGMGPGMGAGAAHAPGMGRGMQAHRGMRFDEDSTPGWALMSEAEREAHRAAVTAFSDYGQCRTYVERHHAEMMERAREQGRTLAPTSGRDACEALKP
jgi:hypothetical protein